LNDSPNPPFSKVKNEKSEELVLQKNSLSETIEETTLDFDKEDEI